MKKKLTFLLATILFLTVATTSYSKDEGEVVKGCEPFESVASKDTVCLMLHGLGGCPHEVRELGQYLTKKGFSTVGIRYLGHGIKGNGMSDYGWEDWYNAAESEYLKLKKQYKNVYVVGFSTGSTIGLRLAEKYKIDKLVLLSPFIYISYKWYYILPPEVYLTSVGKLIDGLPSNMTIVHVNDPQALKEYVKGDYFSFKATRSALDLIKLVKDDIKKVTSPVLLMQGKDDETTDYRSSEYVYDNISSTTKKFITLHKSNHLIPLDYEKRTVFREVNKFLTNDNILE